MKPLRLAYARIAQETNALSPLRTELDDFHRVHYLEGDELDAVCAPGKTEAEGFLKNAELSGFIRGCSAQQVPVEAIPLMSAWAVPAGRLSTECMDTLSGRLKELLRAAGPVDGIYLCLHGAMRSEESTDPDGELIAMVRAIVGESVPVVVSLDLHAVMTPLKVESADALCAYKTNPHRDHKSVGKRCAQLLIDFVQHKRRPAVAWRSLPMLMGGGTTLEFLQPMRAIFKRMKEMEKDPRVLDVSAFMSQPWHDHPDLGWASYVVTDDDPDLAERLADELAQMLWATKDVPPPAFDTVEQGINKARSAKVARQFGAVFFSDTSDVVTAGAPGENTEVIRGLIEGASDLNCLTALRDEDAVDQLYGRPPGSGVVITVGGKIDPEVTKPITLKGVLVSSGETTGFGRAVVVRQGHVSVCITEKSPAVMKPAFYQELGLSVRKADIVVVKNFFPWRLFCALYNRKSVNVRTRGITDLDAAKVLDFADPMHPMDEVTDWRATDRRRRDLND
jgi:microcystin degradation protein MlrC